jgi:hypothetical protein
MNAINYRFESIILMTRFSEVKVLEPINKGRTGGVPFEAVQHVANDQIMMIFQ